MKDRYQLHVYLPGNAGCSTFSIKTKKGWSVECEGSKNKCSKAKKSWDFWEHKTKLIKL